MSFDADNGEKIVKASKADEEFKSPGRRAAEERAERIRAAEEYRKKLEAEKIPVPPKKTKAAEQKEQAKLEKIAREQEEKAAWLEEQRAESERRISALRERLGSLSESIEKAESTVPAPQVVKVEAPEKSEANEPKPEEQPKKKISPIKLKNLIIHIPVQSFSFPCAVKRNKPKAEGPESQKKASEENKQGAQCAPSVQYVPAVQYMPPMMYPVMPQQSTTMLFMPPPMQPPIKTEPEAPADEPAPQKPKQVPLKQKPAPKPQPELPVKSEPQFADLSESLPQAKQDPIYRPVITYGATVSQGGWEYEIEDEEDRSAEPNEVMPIDEDPTLADADELDSDFAEEQPKEDVPEQSGEEAQSSLPDVEGEFSDPDAQASAPSDGLANESEPTGVEEPIASPDADAQANDQPDSGAIEENA